jgi:hypothetical protein
MSKKITLEAAMELMSKVVRSDAPVIRNNQANGRYSSTIWHYSAEGEWLLRVSTTGYLHNNETHTSYIANLSD